MRLGLACDIHSNQSSHFDFRSELPVGHSSKSREMVDAETNHSIHRFSVTGYPDIDRHRHCPIDQRFWDLCRVVANERYCADNVCVQIIAWV